MQIFKILLIIFLLLSSTFYGMNSLLFAQDTNQKNPGIISKSNTAVMPNNTQPIIGNPNMQTPAMVPADMQASIQAKLDEAKTYLKQADDFYNAGEYDKGTEFANKAKAAADDVSKLKADLAKYTEANTKIEQAKSLIGQAENKEADKIAPEELANAKTSLLSAQNSFEKKDFPGAATFADESIKNANLALTKIDEQKKYKSKEQLLNLVKLQLLQLQQHNHQNFMERVYIR